MNEPYHYVVVGGGSAGMICASYLKAYWGNNAKITVIYDHKNPGIGVGESLTPIFYDYLHFVGISRDDLVREVNATVKLGLKFKNWKNDGNYFYHNFGCNTNRSSNYPLEFIHEIITNQYDGHNTYGSFFMENNRIPSGSTKENVQSLHIDATLFGRFIEDRFKNTIDIIDGVIKNVVVNEKGISELLLTDGRILKGDFFIDASGFQSILMRSLENEWIDMSDWLPIDRCIPNPLPYAFNTQPPYTTSEATEDGWILQVPLSNRWGTGYLYSSNFLSEEKAFEKFENFIEKNYTSKLNNTSKVLKFKSGYWGKQWVKNCICVGLSSGFAEPLEATNIHHTVHQIMEFVHFHNCTSFISTHSVEVYNKKMIDFYKSVYLYLRFCYDTKRTDSDFWKYLTSNTPKEVENINEMLQNGIVSDFNLSRDIFGSSNFLIVGKGQNKINVDAWKKEMLSRNLTRLCTDAWYALKKNKWEKEDKSIDHLQYIRSMKPW